MAEFCLDCENKFGDKLLTERDVILSEDFDWCDECGQYRRVVIGFRKHKWFYDVRMFFKKLVE